MATRRKPISTSPAPPAAQPETTENMEKRSTPLHKIRLKILGVGGAGGHTVSQIAESRTQGNHTLEGGEEAFGKILALRERPTAVLCSNDMTAIGVMRKSYSEKIAVPSDLSVIGFDNIRFSEYILPPLSTIEMSQAQLGRLAFQALLNDVQREKPNPQGTEYLLQTTFVLRESTGLNPRKSQQSPATKSKE